MHPPLVERGVPGPDRDPDVQEQAIDLCARLPLALEGRLLGRALVAVMGNRRNRDSVRMSAISAYQGVISHNRDKRSFREYLRTGKRIFTDLSRDSSEAVRKSAQRALGSVIRRQEMLEILAKTKKAGRGSGRR